MPILLAAMAAVILGAVAIAIVATPEESSPAAPPPPPEVARPPAPPPSPADVVRAPPPTRPRTGPSGDLADDARKLEALEETLGRLRAQVAELEGGARPEAAAALRARVDHLEKLVTRLREQAAAAQAAQARPPADQEAAAEKDDPDPANVEP